MSGPFAGILGVAFVVLLMFIIFMAMNNAQCLIGFVGLAGVMFILRYLRMASIGTAIAFYIATYAYVVSYLTQHSTLKVF